MILYNWPKIFDAAAGNPNECVKIIKMLVEGTIPKNTFDPLYMYSTLNFAGESFLLHPDVLLFNSYKYSVRDVAIYLSMASIRPFSDYLAYGHVHLPTLLAPVNPLEHLDEPNSGLITIEDENIHFLYETPPELTN